MIRYYKQLLIVEYLVQVDVSVGCLIFDCSCVKCYTLFGEGGNIGFDLIGSG